MSKIEIFNFPQKSPEWYLARMGIPTASMFGTVMAQGEGKTRNSYMRKLAGEQITGIPMESYSNEDMERGIEQEPELKSRYCFMHDIEIEPVGFIRNGNKGCSPDGLIGDDGVVEFKSAAPHVMIEILMDGVVPKKHLPQCYGTLWITGRKWVELVIGSATKMTDGRVDVSLPLFVRRIHRDETYIKKITGAVADFNIELRQMVEKIRSMS